MTYRGSLGLSFAVFVVACGPDGTTTETGTQTGTDTSDATTVATGTDPTTTATTGLTSEPTSTPTSVDTIGEHACSPTLPDAGSPCALEGQRCDYPGAACEAFPSAECVGGVWVIQDSQPMDDDCAVACDPDNLPPEGSHCLMEGQFCSPGCSDPCSFCNLLTCELGMWVPAEASPAECLPCEEVCPAVLAAACPGGPPDDASCLAGCADNRAGECGLAHNIMLACIGSSPEFACDDQGRPTVAGCDNQFMELYSCLGL